MAVNKKNIMTRYFFVILLMALIGVAIVVKAASPCLPNDNTGRMWLTVS